MDVLIVGAGTMGRWFGETVNADVAFADVDDAIAQEAADAVGGRVVPLGNVESSDGGTDEPGNDRTDENGDDRSVGSFDAVCIAVPMGSVDRAIEAHAHRAETALLDVSGVMEPALEAMATHGDGRERVSLHPLFAPDRAPGSIAVVRDEPGAVTESILDDLAAAGNELVETTAAEHDAAMESVQAAAHTAVLAFALAAERVPPGFETPIYDGLSELVEQLTGGTPRVYADIQRAFGGADAVATAADRIASADPETVEALYREAADRWAEGERDRSADADGGDRGGRPT